MEQIKDTIKSLFSNWQATNFSGDSVEPGKILKKVLAKKALMHVKLYTFRKGILSLKVDSSSWVYYLNLQKDDLLKKIQKECSTVKELRIYLGE